ncbi:GNAT family N-acetyltransferase [Carboxylicivirga sp. N1Y90]|uniref:GNAT family N-acetyltransferase n=1 Tax=Carboxylicivirga fragile TaxID=3417571 RepID=UPI003D333C2C|nr:GNAT family N-acetyltransferase [Marinilabiliaceae bacterium N1Y90]
MNEIVWLNLPLIEWIGYLASTIVLISLSLSSLVKLRIFNLFGSAAFSFYGFYIGALPVGIMNMMIVFFNIYYLRFLLFKNELFDVVKANSTDEFLRKFLEYHKSDIKRFFPEFQTVFSEDTQILLALRDARIAGVFIVNNGVDGSAEVLLDYVTPQYRDYKTGRFLLTAYKEQYVRKDINHLVCETSNTSHIAYLRKMGFENGGVNSFKLLLS